MKNEAPCSDLFFPLLEILFSPLTTPYYKDMERTFDRCFYPTS